MRLGADINGLSLSYLSAIMSEADIAERICAADTEIDHLEVILQAVKEERQDVHRAHGRMINSRAFINRLPYDIIVDIFGRCVNRQGRATSIQSLSNTCRHWRNIMHDTPRFWNNITCHIEYDAGLVSPDKIHTYARRSGRLGLHLTIIAHQGFSDFERIIQTLEPYLPRCTHLGMDMRQTYAQRIFATTPLPLLRSVSFSRIRRPHDPYDESFSTNPLKNAPFFDHLHLKSNSKNSKSPRLADWSPERIVHLSVANTPLLSSPPEMPCLETLTLHHSFTNISAAVKFFDATPSLHTLRLMGGRLFVPFVLNSIMKYRVYQDQRQGVRPLGYVRSVYIPDANSQRTTSVHLANLARYYLEHPAVNKELEIILDCGAGGSVDNLNPSLRELVATYLPTGQISLAFGAEDICHFCASR